ncbi:metallophosphoesterase [Photobacterium kishitanii]|uniref:Calcineurin-like phosphoesterase domain-containing protein n=1 Tax=Photobacterium kishitanii TaxID=318456 RepID=A0A2T3KME7_9GAMM|nr:metallophosphoesterase [Photobacterium kishitanii]PSV00952.1 hypothetical protein C9J27_02700 [Photobacterium kishitanii]
MKPQLTQKWLDIVKESALLTINVSSNIKERGRIFLFTDIHGAYDLVVAALEHLGFSGLELNGTSSNTKNADIAISLGDNIDRGKQSLKTALFIKNNPNIIPIQGNHEKMHALATRSSFKGGWYNDWIKSGGYTWENDCDKFTHLNIQQWEERLPIGIELNIDGKCIALTHGDLDHKKGSYCGSWNETKLKLLNYTLTPTTKRDISETDRVHSKIMCGRKSFSNEEYATVPDATCVIHGHTPIDEGRVKVLGNTCHIDTNAINAYIKINNRTFIPHSRNTLTILEYKLGGNILGSFEAHYFTFDEDGYIDEL